MAQPARAALDADATNDSTAAYSVQALEEGDAGNGIRVEVHHPDDAPADQFRVEVRRGEDHEVFDGLTTTRRQRNNVVTVVNQRSKLIRLEETAAADAALARPAAGAVVLDGGAPAPTDVVIGATEYVGDSADRTGFAGLETVETVTMVCVPDLMAAYEQGKLDLEQVKAVQLAMIAHCELMGDRMAILDPPPGLNAQQIREWRVDVAGYDSKYAALYWPQVKVFDPLSGQNRFMPPSGHVAGMWARSDGQRGVHKAPANEVLFGVIDLETRITRGEHDLLNPVAVNCIRSFPGRGIRVWGARTLSSDPAWRYINVRRLFNYVESSILAGTSWVVFEPNDTDLWGRVKRTISTFLYRVWLDGALFGTTAEQAYYVKCDDETNPSEVIESGQVVCEIGISPVKPAEFVVFRLAQLPSGTSAIKE
jgi:hypothetical protein